MKISGNAIRPGMVIEHKGRLWAAVKTQHTQPGKGGAYLQVELRDIRNGTKLNERFRSSENVERARLDQHNHQYLYREDENLTFMDTKTFDQVTLHQNLVGEAIDFLQDDMIVIIESYEGEPVGVKFPDSTICTIAETDAVVKGQTAAASFKPALLDNGVRISVPPHIEAGTRILVNIAERAYVERVKD